MLDLNRPPAAMTITDGEYPNRWSMIVPTGGIATTDGEVLAIELAEVWRVVYSAN